MGLLLEHQLSIIIEQIASVAGKVLEVDPTDNTPKDVDGYRARVKVNIKEPIRQEELGALQVEYYQQPQPKLVGVEVPPPPPNMTDEARNHFNALFGGIVSHLLTSPNEVSMQHVMCKWETHHLRSLHLDMITNLVVNQILLSQGTDNQHSMEEVPIVGESTPQTQIMNDVMEETSVEANPITISFSVNTNLNDELEADMDQALIASYASHRKILSINVVQMNVLEENILNKMIVNRLLPLLEIWDFLT
ncbi:hypothetical protein IFM89_009328 [Coptis chinensis]|uniref:Uncharacterized protein n=1 Tax=Coptis chinensis TaxID=261450 RepID=A0A835LLV4_9MAGN|nr:hypothetical protein IFM89_009328 [Coptis chinensis]